MLRGKKKSKANRFGFYTAESIHPGFSVDCVILAFHKGKLKVLLNKFHLKDYWALPGGFMFNNENAEQAADRILRTRTGLTGIHLRQFHLFSDPQRTVMEQNTEFVHVNATKEGEGDWLLRRFVTMGYYALVRYGSIKQDSVEDELSRWYDINDMPRLYSDHQNIIQTALDTIRVMLPVVPVGYELLPEKFTMTDLRMIYEILLDKKLDRRNFQRKVLSEKLVLPLDEKKSDNAYNAPILYTFNREMIE